MSLLGILLAIVCFTLVDASQPSDHRGHLTTLLDIGQSENGESTVHKRVKRVWYGVYSVVHSRPWMISLRDEKDTHFCGASLLRVREDMEESDIGLTATKCARKNTIAVLGAHGLHDTGDAMVEVEGFYPYTYMVPSLLPGIIPAEVQGELAIIKFNRTVKFTKRTQPIQLPRGNESIGNGHSGIIAGWGEMAGAGPQPDFLQEVNIEIISPFRCEHKEAYPTFDRNSMFCVLGLPRWRPQTSFCKGDEGGAYFNKTSETGPNVIFGIAIEKTRCGSKSPNVLVNVAYFAWWIRSAVQFHSSLSESH